MTEDGIDSLWRRVQEQNRQIETLRARYAHQALKADAFAARVQQLEAERNESEAEETLLRRLLWLRHGCPIIQLYGDDGEMQCGTCGIDFVRATAVTIEAIWRRAALAPTQRPT